MSNPRPPYLAPLILSLILLPLQAVGQSPTPLPELVRRAETAVVLIRSYSSAGEALGVGSGFTVADGRIVTNAHVLEDAAYVEVYDHRERILGTTDHAQSLSTRVDLAVLPAVSTAAGVLPLAAEEPPVGETVVVFGAPQGLTNTVSTGIVSGYRDRDGLRWMQITAPISQGSSGGPVVNERGQVVGVSVALLREGQNLNFAVPVRDVRALVGSPPGHLAFPAARSARGGLSSTPAGPPSGTAQDARGALANLPPAPLTEVVHGELSSGSLRLDSGHYIESYGIDARQGEVFTAVAVSEDFDIDVTAYGVDSAGELESLGYDDDGAGGTNSLLVVRLRRDGPVGFVISSYRAGATGAYRFLLVAGDVSAEVLSSLDQDSPEPATRWVVSSSNDAVQNYVDRESVRQVRTGNAEAWVRTEYTTIRRERWATYDRDLTLFEFDCRGRRTLMREIVYYLDDELQDSSTISSARWESWVPGSVGEKDGLTVCELAGVR